MIRSAQDAELGELSAISAWAFGATREDAAAWWSAAGQEHARVAISGGHVAGGLLEIPMGQWFGGRSVPMVGVAGVCVAPEERGRGVAAGLMRALLKELASRGVPLSALYPATHTLYRSVGYEQAGSRFRARLEPAKLPMSERDLPIARVSDADFESIAAAYARDARGRPGYLDRGDYAWNRVRNPRGEPAHAWVVAPGGQVEGYVYMTQKRGKGMHYDLGLTDIVANTPRAARRLLALLADQRSLADCVIWHTGPSDSLLAVLPERIYELKLSDYFMLRLIDVKAALRARGYAPVLTAELDLEIDDPLLPHNQGRVRLRIADGAGEIEPGGAGSLRVSERGLAALYAGFLSAHALKRAGLVDGDDRALETATAVFAGPAPAMSDHF